MTRVISVGESVTVETTSSSSFRGRYLGTDRFGRHQFDLRPEFGTTTVPEHEIVSVTPDPGTKGKRL